MVFKLRTTTTVFRSNKSRSGFFQIWEQKAWTKFVVKLFAFVGISIFLFSSLLLFWGWELCLCNYLLHDLLPLKQHVHPRTSKRVYKLWENYISLNFTTSVWDAEKPVVASFLERPQKDEREWNHAVPGSKQPPVY